MEKRTVHGEGSMLLVLLRAERRPRRTGVAQCGSGDSAMHGGHSVTAGKEKRPRRKVESEDVKLECKAIGQSFTDGGVQRWRSPSEPKGTIAWFGRCLGD